MKDYAILTDSCCDLSAAMVEELELEVLPLSFHIDGGNYFNYSDNRDMDPHVFYEMLRGGKMGTTSAINPEAFQEKMTALVESGRDVLCIAFSSGLSTTYQSAVIAAGDVMAAHPGSQVVVIDSLCASMGQGLLVYLAARERKKGKSLEEVRAFVEERKPHLDHRFTVDDLHHLKRGGRVSATAAVLGTMLQMKPMLHVDDEGHLIPLSKVRGRRASIKGLFNDMVALVEDPSVVFISHGDCLEDAQELAAMIREKFPVERLEINYVGPVIGNHSGPGTLALFFQGKHR